MILYGHSSNEERLKMVESILNAIAKDSAVEKFRREVDLLTQIQNSRKEDGENTAGFTARFTAAVATYSNQNSLLTAYTSRQFAILMLRDAGLSPDIMNSLLL